MAIEKYVTSGIILESYDQGEHDKVYKIFTREFGLLLCHAKSVRKLESKLRAHLLPRSISLVTLVKGREVWRLVGAEKETVEMGYIHEVVALLKRFVRGEGEHKELYDRLMEFVTTASSFDEASARLLLYLIILIDLGYADKTVIGITSKEMYTTSSMHDMYTYLMLTKDVARTHVQKVLKEIQL